MNNSQYRRHVVIRTRLIGLAFLALTAVILVCTNQLGCDATAAAITAVFGLTAVFCQESWLDF